jgi:hypothetical protein
VLLHVDYLSRKGDGSIVNVTVEIHPTCWSCAWRQTDVATHGGDDGSKHSQTLFPRKLYHVVVS